jgi:hypothetical protein
MEFSRILPDVLLFEPFLCTRSAPDSSRVDPGNFPPSLSQNRT